jgi:DNA-binding response OmpR family regulator
LLVADDAELMSLLTFLLTQSGFEVIQAAGTPAALRSVDQQPHLTVLDLSGKNGNELELIARVQKGTEAPVIVLTNDEDATVVSLEAGADDCIMKPLGQRELVARIRACLRRSSDASTLPEDTYLLGCGTIQLDLRTRTVKKGGRTVNLTGTEFRLLRCLIMRAGKVVPHAAILREVWGYDDTWGTDLLRVTMRRLRRKLEEQPGRPTLLRTVPSVGFMLVADAAPQPDVLSAVAHTTEATTAGHV